MESLLLVVHVVIALGIVGLIMLQQGKGAEMGASFGGGSSQTVFGAAGTGNFFSRLTAIFAAVFFATSLTLAMLAKNSVSTDRIDIPELETVQPVEEDLSALQEEGVPSLPDADSISLEDDVVPTDELPSEVIESAEEAASGQ